MIGNYNINELKKVGDDVQAMAHEIIRYVNQLSNSYETIANSVQQGSEKLSTVWRGIASTNVAMANKMVQNVDALAVDINKYVQTSSAAYETYQNTVAKGAENVSERLNQLNDLISKI